MNKIKCLLLCLGLILCLCGCNESNTYISYTYSVDTGDTIKIKLDTSNEYSLSSELPFVITCGEDTLSQGTFITEDDYEQYVVVVESDENAVIIDSGEKDGNEYIFWSYNGNEYNYAIFIDDSNTGVVLGNNVSEESARACFERLEIRKE